jgi:putative oxidoreductase
MNGRLSRLPQAPGLAALVLRLTVGTVLMAHGISKLERGIGAFADTVDSRGIPFPMITASATVTIEVAGGAMLLLGLLTRLWSALATLLMIGTTLVVKLDAGLLGQPGQGSGMELDLLVMASALAITLVGPGPVSVDHAIGIDRAMRAARRASAAMSSAPAGSDAPNVTVRLDTEEEVARSSSQRRNERR